VVTPRVRGDRARGRPDIPRLEALGTQTGRVFADLLRFFAIFHRERYGWDGSPIHDAVAVARPRFIDLLVEAIASFP